MKRIRWALLIGLLWTGAMWGRMVLGDNGPPPPPMPCATQYIPISVFSGTVPGCGERVYVISDGPGLYRFYPDGTAVRQ